MRPSALALCGACVALAAGPAAAEDATEFKLTLGRYASSDGNTGLDANLRATYGAHVAWLGGYREQAGYRQARTGYEYHASGDVWRPVLSLQAASGGAVVGSASAEIGGDTYLLAGWGRTNVRNYVNLNYDPNDAITLGVGSRALAGTELLLFQVRDDRLHTGQQVTHAVARWHLADDQRLSLDLSAKRGLTSDGDFVHDRSWSLGYDRGAFFVRFAHDPHAGFTAANQNRLSLGSRF
jgi:hypothetical protein